MPKTETTDDDVTIEEDRAVANAYAFVGNLKRPFDTIQWLCSKTQSSKESFGFLFFENLDGYHFRSIEKLIKQDALTYEQTNDPFQNGEGGFHNSTKINLNQSNNVGMNCRMGMYAQ